MPLPLVGLLIPPIAEMMMTLGGAVAVGSLAYSTHDAILETRDDIMGFFDEMGTEYNTVKAIPQTSQLTKMDIKPIVAPKLEAKRNAIQNTPAKLKEKAILHEYTPVKTIEKPTAVTAPAVATVGTNLIDVLNTKNKLVADNNSLISALLQIQYMQVEQLEIANKLREAKLYSDMDMATANIIMQNDMNVTLKGQLEAMQKGTVVQSEDTKKYFSALATYFDFMNTGKIGEKEDFLGGTVVPQILKDVAGNPIIPREAQAKKDISLPDKLSELSGIKAQIKDSHLATSDYHNYKNTAQIKTVNETITTPREAEARHHAEKHEETKEMNDTDFSTLLFDHTYADPMLLVKELFTDLKKSETPKNLIEGA